jgi:hypothetical protein
LLATQAALDEIRNIVAMLVGRALEGDTNAASIVLSKVLPSVKAQAEKVQFDLNTDAPISEQVAQVLDAIAAGAIAPDVGGSLSTAWRASQMCGLPRSWPLGSRRLRRLAMPGRKMELFAQIIFRGRMRPAALKIPSIGDRHE